MDEEMELMDSWMKDVRGFHDISVSHRYLLSVQKRMVNDWWFAMVDIHVKVDSMADASSSQELVKVLFLILIDANTSVGCVEGPLVITAAVHSLLVLSAADPSMYIV